VGASRPQEGEERVPTIWELCCEVFRLDLMRRLEGTLAQAGFRAVAGVDEAGRGCLAGPVVAAAVIPDPERLVPGVDDSKKLSCESRTRLAAEIRDTARAWAVAEIDAGTIDRVNILRATRLAMRRALADLAPHPDCVVTDAVTLPGVDAPCLPVVKGDAWSYAVACASILAKDARDRRMSDLDRDYPQYGFARHKGYGAPEHVAAIARFGPSPLHRLTFSAVVPRLAELER
jgi:ribonuclease HII